jgi:hypothetical protein
MVVIVLVVAVVVIVVVAANRHDVQIHMDVPDGTLGVNFDVILETVTIERRIVVVHCK